MLNTIKTGFIEILIGCIISIVLLAGLINVMLSHYHLNNVDKTLLENKRYLHIEKNFLNRAQRLALALTPTKFTNTNPYVGIIDIFPPNSQLLQGTNHSLNGSDSISVRYQGNTEGNILDCNGTPLTPAKSVENLYFITANSNLACVSIINGIPDFNNLTVLVEGLQAMHIRYITDNNAPMNTPGLFSDRINSIKMSLLLQTTEQASPLEEAKYYSLQDEEVGPFNDRTLRKIVTSVIPIKSSSKK